MYVVYLAHPFFVFGDDRVTCLMGANDNPSVDGKA